MAIVEHTAETQIEKVKHVRDGLGKLKDAQLILLAHAEMVSALPGNSVDRDALIAELKERGGNYGITTTKVDTEGDKAARGASSKAKGAAGAENTAV